MTFKDTKMFFGQVWKKYKFWNNIRPYDFLDNSYSFCLQLKSTSFCILDRLGNWSKYVTSQMREHKIQNTRDNLPYVSEYNGILENQLCLVTFTTFHRNSELLCPILYRELFIESLQLLRKNHNSWKINYYI